MLSSQFLLTSLTHSVRGEVVERSDDRRGFCRFAFTPNSCSGPR